MTRSFDGKVAIITGGSSGIGRAAAIRFVERGARVLIASRGSYKGNNTVAEIREGAAKRFTSKPTFLRRRRLR